MGASLLGAELIAWTVRLGVLCFAVTLGGWAAGVNSGQGERLLRWWWTVGWGLFVLHMLAAFHFQHGWSHQQAYADTAMQTGELIGWEFGGGVYFNYLLIVLWGGDVLAWWSGWAATAGYRVWRKAVLAYLCFIVFNGVVVFKGGWVRWVGVAVSLVIAGLWARRGFRA
jgi:hypothetical protein